MKFAKQLETSVEDYLQGELVSDIKHEYINGDVYAMVGAKRAHNMIAGNLFAALHNHLRGSPCLVFGSDMKVYIKTQTEDCFYYPDLQVTCSVDDKEESYNTQPKLIIEVLSDSTERRDRADKFYRYRKLTSLEEYVLVAQDIQRVEIYRRANAWDLELFGENECFCFDSVGLTLTVTEVYEGVEFV